MECVFFRTIGGRFRVLGIGSRTAGAGPAAVPTRFGDCDGSAAAGFQS